MYFSGLLRQVPRIFFAALSSFLLLTGLSAAQASFPNVRLLTPVSGQTITIGTASRFRITIEGSAIAGSGNLGTNYLYAITIQRGTVRDPSLDFGIQSPSELSQATEGVDFLWPASLGPGTYQLYVAAFPKSAPDQPTTSSAVSVNVVAPTDTTPDPFSFISKGFQPTNSTCTSDNPVVLATSSRKSIIIGGINAPTPVSVTNGANATGSEISIAGGAWATSGTINVGQSLAVRHITASSFGTTSTSTVNVGGVTANFSCTTEPADTTPDPFSIPSRSGLPLDETCVSAPIRLTGFNAPTIVSVSEGGRVIQGEGSAVLSTSIAPGTAFFVQLRTSTNANTATTVIVNAGGVTAPFTCTTGAGTPPGGSVTITSPASGATITVGTPTTFTAASTLALAPDIVTFFVATGGTPNPSGDVAIARATSVSTTSASATATWPATLSPGTYQIYALWTTAPTTAVQITSALSSVTVVAAPDTTPDPFSFASQTNTALSSVITSAGVTITGFNTNTPIAITNGEYSINGGPFTSATGILIADTGARPTVQVRHTSAATLGTNTVTTLTIGGVSGTFTSTTASPDTTPAAFSFVNQTGVAQSTIIESNAAEIIEINAPTPISVTNGEYSIDGAAFTSVAGLLEPPTTAKRVFVRVRHTSAAAPGTDTTTVLNIGGVTAAFTSTTVGPDSTPDAFVFTPVFNVALNTAVESNVVTITGINTTTALRVTGGEYSLNGGAYTSAAARLNAGATVRVRHTSATTPGTDTTTTLTVGDFSSSFVSTTIGADTTPDTLLFTEQLGVATSAVITSNAQTITGINTAINVSIANGEFAINGGAFTSAAATANNGDTVTVRHTSAAGFNAPTVTTLTTGTISNVFRSVTRAQIVVATPTMRIIDPPDRTGLVAPATIGVAVAVEDPSGNARISDVVIRVGSLSQNAALSQQSCPSTTAPRCVVYRAIFSGLSDNNYTISASAVIAGPQAEVAISANSILISVRAPIAPPPPPPVEVRPSDIVIVGAAPNIVPGGNVSFTVKAIDSAGAGLPNIPLVWTIVNGDTKARQQKAACSGSPADTPNTQQVTTDATGNASVSFKASCAAGGRELSIIHSVAGGVSKRVTLTGPNQLASDVALMGASTTTPLIVNGSVLLTARASNAANAVNGAITTWAISPANAGTVQSPVQTDEKGEAQSTLVLNSGVKEATLTVCIEGRAITCKTYAIRSAIATVIAPATSTVNAVTQAAITAPRVQITQIRDRMQQLRNEQSGGFYNGVGIEFPGGRVGTDSASSDKPGEGEKKTSGSTTVPKPYSGFMLGDVSLSQKKGQTGFDVSTRGLTAGVDYRFSKAWVAGAAIGYSRALTELNLGGEQKASSVSGSLFAQWLPENDTYVSLVVNSGRGSYKLSRPTSDLSIASASPKGQSAAVQAEAGYMWSRGGFRLQPFVRGEYSKATIDPIVERGSAEALFIDKQRVRSNTLSAGLISDYAVSTSMGVFIPSARLEFYRENQRINQNFARLINGTPVLVELASDPFDKSYGSFGLNLQWLYGIYGTPISSFVGYEHTFGKSGFKINRVTFGVKIPLR